MVDKAVVRIAGTIVEEARHGVCDSLGGFSLAGGDVGDCGQNGAVDASGVVEEGAYLSL